MSSENNLLILELLLLMAFADKVYMEEEKELINEISEKLTIPDRKKQQIIEEVEQSKNITKECRETANKIINKEDREKTIELLSEMITKDKIVHQKELFAFQIIADEWGMYLEHE